MNLARLRPRKLSTRVAVLVMTLTMVLAAIGCIASFLLSRAVIHASIDDTLHVAVNHEHTSAQELAEELPSGAIVMVRRGDRLDVRANGPDRVVAAEDATVLRTELDRPDGLRDVKLPERDDMRVATLRQPGTEVLAAVSMEPAERDLTRLAAWQLALWVPAGIVASAVGVWLTRRQVRPLQAVTRTARSIAETPAESVEDAVSRRVPEPRRAADEVGVLTHAINDLLRQVEATLARRDESEAALRTMLADVSHELRTPLAVVRSHAELSASMLARAVEAERSEAAGDSAGGGLPGVEGQDGGADHGRRAASDVRALELELAPSLRRIERESIRMARLVEDLLLLAHLDAGQRAAQESVDVTFLALEALSDAKLMAPKHLWAFDAPDEACEIVGDENGVRRVIVNLVTNARRHTPAGTRVQLSVRDAGDSVVVEVADDGPGLPASVAAEPGRRFKGAARSDTDRRGGLGLAITMALAESMEASIHFDSSTAGTTAIVTLPRRPAALGAE